MLTLLSIDRINGSRINKAKIKPQKNMTPAKLHSIHKRELHKLYKLHPELSDTEKLNLDVNFQYKEDEIVEHDPLFMPKPVCFWCQKVVDVNYSGNLKCSCGKEWYNWLYDLKRSKK